MVMLPPLSITTLTNPTFALAQTKARFDHNASQKKPRTRLSSPRYLEIGNRFKTWIVNQRKSGLLLIIEAIKQEALSIAETA